MVNNIFQYASKNKFLFFIIFVYAGLLLSVINWGIPNLSHPYNYHMDEWHQLESVRNTFKFGTPNIPGSAHGPIFQFLLTGIYLIPFYILHIVNPFIIKSGLVNIPEQTKLFEILRLNTLLFGILSIVVMHTIVRKYFNISSKLALVVFVFTPMFIALSNYYKYDIALLFWIVLSIYSLLRYGRDTSLKNFLFAGLICGITLSTKISALPILPIYIFAFFLYNKNWKKQYKHLLLGLVIFVMTFFIVGIPDVLLGKASYGEFLSANLVGLPNTTSNIIFDYNPWWIYLFLIILPSGIGNALYSLLVLVFVYLTCGLFFKKMRINSENNKSLYLIYFSFILFFISLLQLKIGANGNRLLVLLPYIAIMIGVTVPTLLSKYNGYKKNILITFILLLLTFQVAQSVIFVTTKWDRDVRQDASFWLIKNIKHDSTIGVENIPIYQLLPDVVLKEYYFSNNNKNIKTNFKYQVIDAKQSQLPKTIIITNRELEGTYFRSSSKKDLLKRLSKEGYVIKEEFKPSVLLYLLMRNELRMFTSGLVPIPTITIYTKP